MNVRLDLHCHSIASDGSLSLWELAQLAHKVGLGGLVVTDHCSPNNAYHTNLTALETIESLNLELPVPVIIGSEIKTPYGEFLLFGKKACKHWDQYKLDLNFIAKSFGIEQYWDMFYRFVLHKITCSRSKSNPILSMKPTNLLSYGLILCHPREDLSWYKRMPDFLWENIHGFEIQNDFEDYGEINPDVVSYLESKIPKCKAVRNTDCHGDELGRVFNEIDIKEVSENQLIHWLRS